MQDYKKLKVWEKSHSFTLEIYRVTKLFPKDETFGLTSQLKRAASSIPANIAEGCGKFSSKELAHFLNIALGSSNESEYFLLLAKDLDFLRIEDFNQLGNLINEIKGMLIKLIQSIREQPTT